MTTAGDPNADLLRQVQGQNGVRRPEGGHHEERPRRGPGQATCVVCGARKFRIGAIPQQ